MAVLNSQQVTPHLCSSKRNQGLHRRKETGRDKAAGPRSCQARAGEGCPGSVSTLPEQRLLPGSAATSSHRHIWRHPKECHKPAPRSSESRQQPGGGSCCLQGSPPSPVPTRGRRGSQAPGPEALATGMQQTGPGWVPVAGAEGMPPYTQGSHTSAWRTYPEVLSFCGSHFYGSTPSPRRLQALPCQLSLGFLISPTHTLSAPGCLQAKLRAGFHFLVWRAMGAFSPVQPSSSGLFGTPVRWFPSCLWTLQAPIHPLSSWSSVVCGGVFLTTPSPGHSRTSFS